MKNGSAGELLAPEVKQLERGRYHRQTPLLWLLVISPPDAKNARLALVVLFPPAHLDCA